MSATLLVNGVVAGALDARDRGLHYGDGLFETLAVYGTRARLEEAHFERLEQGCRRLGLEAPPRPLLHGEIASVATGPRSVVKVIVTRGPGGRGYRPPQESSQTRIVAGYPATTPPEAWYVEGIRARTCTTRVADSPALAGLKHLGRLEQVLARAEWDDATVAEGLMLNARDEVACGTQSNVFVVRDGRLVTPAVDLCGVAGVMRRAVIEWARGRAVGVTEAPLRPADLLAADEVFVTNAVNGAWRIAELDGRRLRRTGWAREFMEWLESR